MNQQEADDYNGPTFNCPNCDGRHPLDGSETCVDRSDYAADDEPILGGQQVSNGARRDGGGPIVSETSDEDPRGDRSEFEFVQGEDLEPDALEHATTPERVIVHVSYETYVDRLRDSPAVEVVEVVPSPTKLQDFRVTFTIPVPVEVDDE